MSPLLENLYGQKQNKTIIEINDFELMYEYSELFETETVYISTFSKSKTKYNGG